MPLGSVGSDTIDEEPRRRKSNNAAIGPWHCGGMYGTGEFTLIEPIDICCGSASKQRRPAGGCVLRAAAGLVCLVGLTGCAAPARPSPVDAFDTITKRALEGDSEFVRAHLDTSDMGRWSEDGPSSDSEAFVPDILTRLQFCRPLSWEAGSTPDRAVVEAASIQPGLFGGAMWKFRIDMIYDAGHEWRIASPPRDQRPIGADAADDKGK